MRTIKTLHKPYLKVRWEIIKYFRALSKRDGIYRTLSLLVVRLTVILMVASLWIAFTLSTGIFTTVFLILLGVGIGCTPSLMPKGLNRFHLPSALLLTLLGGLLCNMLAGLAFFSAKMGVSFWSVLLGRRVPEDIQMLVTVFIDSVRAQDLIYYAVSMAIVIYLAQRNYIRGKNAGQIIEIQLTTGRVYRIGSLALHYLLAHNKVAKFKRSDGWAVVGKDRLRGESCSNYKGPERRPTNRLVNC